LSTFDQSIAPTLCPSPIQQWTPAKCDRLSMCPKEPSS
jgi:hypothetical protein